MTDDLFPGFLPPPSAPSLPDVPQTAPGRPRIDAEHFPDARTVPAVETPPRPPGTFNGIAGGPCWDCGRLYADHDRENGNSCPEDTK